MNERIRELAEQAGITTNLDTDFFAKDPNKWVDYFAEKFAELIVRKCIEHCKDQIMKKKDVDAEGLDYNDGVMDCILALKLHFGDENE